MSRKLESEDVGKVFLSRTVKSKGITFVGESDSFQCGYIPWFHGMGK